MARSLILGNGRYLLNLDERAWIRDIYFPHIGIENHTEGHVFRLGVWADGETYWTDRGWHIHIGYEDGTLVGRTVLRHAVLELELVLRDAVDHEADVFLREITVRDLRGADRSVRVFLHQDFYIAGTDVGDTALFDPELVSVLHYKRDRYFLVGGGTAPEYEMSAFATGKKRVGGAEGTWRDAEGDGTLSNNPIAQGSVDSTVALHVQVPANGEATTYYWLAAGERYGHLLQLNALIRKHGPSKLINRTAAYWRLWLKKHDLNFEGLSNELVRLYKTSLLVMRIHVDQSGAVIAATDSDITHFARDTYTYMWPRDGALVAEAFDRAGFSAISRKFFRFAGELIKKEGYFLHKYHPDRSLASSWHPWVDEHGRKILPIQEDETGLVVWALWEHFRRYRDVEEVRPLYRAFIIRAAEFLAEYRDEATGLPLQSWDLWEERRGVLTFTCAAVWAGLDAASRFAHAFGDVSLGLHYGRAAAEVRQGILEHLWDEQSGRFLRMFVPGDPENGRVPVRDPAPDASLFGLHFLKFLDNDDPRLVSTLESVIQELTVRTPIGGVARYRGDYYHSQTDDWERVPGNPWFIVQCWLASWRFAQARSLEDLEEAKSALNWISARALRSGLLPEQIHPFTGQELSVTPLVWSHAAFVSAIHDYIDSRNAFDACAVCGSPSKARLERALR
jgi:glucoamylase